MTAPWSGCCRDLSSAWPIAAFTVWPRGDSAATACACTTASKHRDPKSSRRWSPTWRPPPRARDRERLFFDPDGLGFVMKNWRGEKHPRYQATSPGEPAVKLAIGERRRIVYVGLTRTKDALYVTATREEQSAREVEMGEQDHFAEILSWALAHPESANVVEAEQLELLPGPASIKSANGSGVVAAVLDRMEAIQPRRSPAAAAVPPEVQISFSQLHDFEVCPIRYRFSQVWRVAPPPPPPAPPAARPG